MTDWSYQTRRSTHKLFPLVNETLLLDVTYKEASKEKQITQTEALTILAIM